MLRVAAEDLALTGGAPSRRPAVPRNLTDSELVEPPAAAPPLVVVSGARSDVCRMTSSQPRECHFRQSVSIGRQRHRDAPSRLIGGASDGVTRQAPWNAGVAGTSQRSIIRPK